MKGRISSLIMWIMTLNLSLVLLRIKMWKRSRIGLLNKGERQYGYDYGFGGDEYGCLVFVWCQDCMYCEIKA